MAEKFVIEITHSAPKLPSLIGPFPSRKKAKAWMRDRSVAGEWNIAPLTDPKDADEQPPRRSSGGRDWAAEYALVRG